MPTLEGELVKAALDYLKRRRIFAWRNNTGAARGTYRGKQRFWQYGYPGSPDILAVYRKRAIGIECKAKGGKQTEKQKAFQVEFENAGGIYILAYHLEDIEDGLSEIR